MAHNIFNEGFIEREGTQRAWHRIGTTFSEFLTAQEALDRAGMNYKIYATPLKVELPDGTLLPADERLALIREPVGSVPTYDLLGIVDKDYSFFQNQELAEMIDRIGSRNWRLETIGCLGKGETIFFCMRMHDFEIKGDVVESYTVFSDFRDGKNALTMMNTPIRVVCQNTLNWGIKEATDKITLRHHSFMKMEAEELASLFAGLQSLREQGINLLTRLTEIPLSMETAEGIINSVYPYPDLPKKVALLREVDGSSIDLPILKKSEAAFENTCNQITKARKNVLETYDRFNDEFPQFANSGYALFNTVAEFEDHIHGGNLRVHRETGEANTSRYQDSVFGNRARTKRETMKLILQ